MALLTEKINDQRPFLLAVISLVLASIALGLGATALLRRTGQNAADSPRLDAFSQIAKTGVLRVGYGGFPPYTSIDPTEPDENRRVKGFSVDLVQEIARRASPPLKVEWHKLNWDTLKTDMLSNKFDFVADPVYETIPRAMDYAFSQPYSYFGIAVAVVRIDENRFKVFDDLDRPDIKIALAAGWTSTEYAQQHLKKPDFKTIAVTENATGQMDEVLNGNAAVALNDVPTVTQYVRAHKKQVKALWLDKPPSSVAGAFMLRKEDSRLKDFLDVAIGVLKVDGTLGRIDAKWNSYGYLPVVPSSPGRGITADPIADKTQQR